MDSLQKIIYLSVICLSLFSGTTTSKEACSDTKCGRRNGYLTIRFPFRVANIQPLSCGYPGFDLYCDASNTTLIHLPNAGNFTVEGINYVKQEIMLSDPNDCLASRLSRIDLSTSPFMFKENRHLSYYNCSEKDERYLQSTYLPKEKISCLSTVPNYAIIGVNPLYFASILDPWCNKFLNNVTAPGNSLAKLSRLGANMLFVWDEPKCGLCEGNVTQCVFKDDATRSTLETVCIAFDPPIAEPGRLSRSARYAIGFSIGLGIPAVIVLFLLLRKIVCSRRRSVAAENETGTSTDLASQQ